MGSEMCIRDSPPPALPSCHAGPVVSRRGCRLITVHVCVVQGEATTMSDALRAERLAIAMRMKENKAALRQVRRSAARDRRSIETEWLLGLPDRRTVVVLFDLAGYDATPAASYLDRRGRSKEWAAKTFVELRDMVQGVFLSTDSATVAAWIDPELAENTKIFEAAHRHLEEFRLHQWALTMNTSCGVAPPSRFLINRLSCIRAAAGRPPPSPAGLPKSRKWAERFRRRWGGRYGALPVGDVLTVAEMIDKALQPRFRHATSATCVVCASRRGALRHGAALHRCEYHLSLIHI